MMSDAGLCVTYDAQILRHLHHWLLVFLGQVVVIAGLKFLEKSS